MKWEYRVVAIDGPALLGIEEQLNALGQDRWECFHVEPSVASKHIIFYLKRKAD